MRDYEKEMTKEQFEKYQRGELDKSELFSMGAIMGYGVYMGTAYEKDGKYYVKYSMGDSCD